MSTTNRRNLLFFLLVLLIATLLQSPEVASAYVGESSITASHRGLFASQRNSRRAQIPSCSEMATRSHCSQNPNKCRWCKSEALDDMCFSKSEAWRLPQQKQTGSLKSH